jgi:acyl-CoA synthetase (NDP forming)
VLCVPAATVLDAARDALAAGVRSLCVISAGFAEVGPEGAARQAALVDLVHGHGARLIGPNCLGLTAAAAALNATFAAHAPLAGSVGFASQSGALGLAVVEQARLRGLGLSAFVSLGNKADVTSTDLLEYWEDDAATRAVALYLESFGDPERFRRVAQRVARTKPIVALKGGVSDAGARAAASHTAALASSETAVEALFRQTGVVRARALEEFLDAARILSEQPLPRGPRIGVVTNGGGLGIVFADACAAEGLELPPPSPEVRARLAAALPAEASAANPIDLLGSATPGDFDAALRVVLDDPAFDAVCVLFARPAFTGAAEVAEAVAAASHAAGAAKPLVAVLLAADSPSAIDGTGLTTFPSPEAAARALGAAARRARWLDRPQGRPVAVEADRAAARAAIDGALARGSDVWLEADEATSLLAAYGVPLVPETVVGSADAAVEAARALGGPVVVKSAEPGAHKTDRGAVALDLREAGAVRAAAERIGAPLLVQPMLAGTELLVGVVRDPSFGPLVACGVGGVAAELYGAVDVALAPLTDVDAEQLIATGPLARLVAGFRGAPPLDAGAVLDVVQRVAALAVDLPEVAELDLNPVLATPSGAIAVDQRIRVRRVP